MFNRTQAPSETDHHNVEPPETLGSYLKDARLRQGLELTAVAEETRINIKNLAALEEDTRAALPADVFTKGFVKIYAAHLKLDPQKAMDLYSRQWGESYSFSPDDLPLTKHTPSACPGIAFILALIALFFGIRFFAPSPPQPDVSPDTPAQTSAPSPEALTPSPATEEFKKPSDTSPVESNTTSSPIPAESDKQLPPYEISLTCTEETPLTMTLDGGQAATASCSPGSPQIWKAAKGFDLTLDHTDGVTLAINGVEVPITKSEGQGSTIHRP